MACVVRLRSIASLKYDCMKRDRKFFLQLLQVRNILTDLVSLQYIVLSFTIQRGAVDIVDQFTLQRRLYIAVFS